MDAVEPHSTGKEQKLSNKSIIFHLSGSFSLSIITRELREICQFFGGITHVHSKVINSDDDKNES